MARITDSLYRFLDTDGDGTGTKQVTGDHSGAAERYYIKSSGRGVTIERLIVHISDAANQSADEYGNLNVALTNGISVTVKDETDTTVLDLTDGLPVKKNADWGRVCYDIMPVVFGVGNDFIQVRWTFSKSGRPVALKPGYSLGIDVNDSFVGLDEHTFMVQGYMDGPS